MRVHRLILVVSLLLGVSVAFAATDPASLSPERQEFYRQLDEATLILETEGIEALTEAQLVLLRGASILGGSGNELDEMGGPDEFGYEFIDSQEDNGPEYDWIDISETGTETDGWQADVVQGPYDLDFDFSFYSIEYDQFWFCAHGWFSFDNEEVEWTNSELPDGIAPDNMIAINWDDHIVDWSTYMYYELLDDGRFVIQVDQKYEAILYPNGNIILQYHEDYTGVAGSFDSETVGIENEDGSIGLTASFNNDPANYPYGGLAIKFYSFQDAYITGTVTESVNGDSLDDAHVLLYYEDTEILFDEAVTDTNGYYSLTLGVEDTFDVVVWRSGYSPEMVESVIVVEDSTYVIDFEMDVETTTGFFSGTLYSADTPNTPVADATISLYEIGVSTTTDVNGEFDLGEQIVGLYNVYISHDPAGSEGYHDRYLYEVDLGVEGLEVEWTLHEVYPPSAFNASGGNGLAELSWEAPSNTPQEVNLLALREEINNYYASIADIQRRAVPQELAKLPEVIQRLHSLENLLEREENRTLADHPDELDEIETILGYRISLDGEYQADLLITGNSYTLPGLDNGHLYQVAVAADYGYGEDYLVFSDPVDVRPLPPGGYILTEIDYDWIEINPNNGGEGSVAIDAGDDSNSGEISVDPLSFNFYGTEYSSFAACTNGWMSFIDFTSNNIGVTLPATSNPNATIVPLNGDYHGGEAGDGVGIWYYVDEDENQIIIQFLLRPYSGNTGYRYSYEVVLDCDTDVIYFNYEEADDWVYYNRAGAIAGVENQDGTVGTTFAMADITNETTYQLRYVEEYGNVIGWVEDIDGNPVADAYVFIQEDPAAFGISNEEGYYEILLANTANAPYTLLCQANGYEQGSVEDVQWEEGEFEIETDFVLTPVSCRTAPRLISWDGDYDDGVGLALGVPGSYDNMLAMQYDDGIAADAWTLPAAGEDVTWAVPFEVSSEGIVAQLEWQVADPSSVWGAWPDATADPVTVKIFADKNGQPGSLLYENIVTPENGLVLVNPATPVEGRFWAGLSQSGGREAVCVDADAAYEGLLHYSTDDNTWRHVENTGDPLVRVSVYSEGQINQDYTFTPGMNADFSRSDVRPVAATHQSPFYGHVAALNTPKAPIRQGWSQGIINRNELDEFLGYYIWYSTDGGENYSQANEDPIEVDAFFLDLGSDLENSDIMIFATAWVDSEGVEFESNPSQTVTAVFNMAPSGVSDFEVTDIDHLTQTATITWDAPTTNADGSPCVDLAGYVLYRGTTFLDTLDAETTTWDESVIEPAYYTYAIIAFDEVMNKSDSVLTVSTRIGNPPFFSGFEPDAVPEEDITFEPESIWECGEPTTGPGEAYEGDYVWATYLESDYQNSDDGSMISLHGWEPISENLMLGYYHWIAYESGYDGYNVQISTDNGDTWTIIAPIGGYPDATVVGLDNTPGFTQSSGGWQRVEFDLTQYAEADSIHLKFRHGTDTSANGYYGAAIDNMEIWGVMPDSRGAIEGFVFDTEDQPMEGALVSVLEYPEMQTYTDANGYYCLINIPADTLVTNTIRCEYIYYWDEDYEVTLLPFDTLSVNFTNESGHPMSFPDGEISNTSLEILVDIDSMVGDSTGFADIDLESNGSGPLQYGAYLWVVDNAVFHANKKTSKPRITNASPVVQRTGRMMTKRTTFTGPNLCIKAQNRGPQVQVSGELDELFDPLLAFDAGSLTENDGIMGAVTLDDGIYVSAVALSEDVGDNFLYQFSHDGSPIAARTYPDDMLGNSTSAIMDMAYDPETTELFGCNEDGDIFRFSRDLTTHQWIGNVGVYGRAMAYDYDSGYIFLSDGESIFALYDINSGASSGLPMPEGIGGLLGLAYNPFDIEGYTIYALAQNEDGEGGYIHRFSMDEMAWEMNLHELYLPEYGSSAGFEINPGFHHARYDITSVLQGEPDYINIWEGPVMPLEWLFVEPNTGLLEPGESTTLTITVDLQTKGDTVDLEPGDEINAELVFGGPHWANPPVVDVAIIFYYGADEETSDLPTKYALHQNFPNPFNPATQIKFDLVKAQDVRLTVYNVMGQEVMELVNHRMEAGFHAVTFDATRLASGMYFYRLQAGPFTDLKRMVLIK